MKKSLLSFILCLILVFSSSLTVFAAENEIKNEMGVVEVEVDGLTRAYSGPHPVVKLNALFGQYDTYAESNIGSFTISNLPANAKITKIVVTSTKSYGSVGTITLYVAKAEDNGDGTFDLYTDDKIWASTLNYTDFGLYNLSANGTYYIYFDSVRYSTGSLAAATLNNVKAYVYYN